MKKTCFSNIKAIKKAVTKELWVIPNRSIQECMVEEDGEVH